MKKLIKNNWYQEPGKPFFRTHILMHEIHPEGLDVDRIRFFKAGRFKPKSDVGHIISVLHGDGKLYLEDNYQKPLQLEAGVHLYLPPNLEVFFDAKPKFELLHVSSASASQAHGKQFLIRDEKFLKACTSESHSLRWILTPQYLSRRIFLHHDPILLSKSGNPVSWFHTTMFEVTDLPRNEDGESVFKMSYNSRTEFNVCYNVKGSARVRMAQHPYQQIKQAWDPWLPLDNDTTYHLNETSGSCEEKYYTNGKTKTLQFFRNKHEVHIANGHVSLFCLFDPAPIGIEHHQPGEYSDYEPLSKVIETEAYASYQQETARYDEMLDRLSLAKAIDELDKFKTDPTWELYLQGKASQTSIETNLINMLAAKNNKRGQIISSWT